MIRIVVTGLGAVTPLGTDAQSTWEALVSGRSGVGALTCFDASDFSGAIAAEVRNFRPEQFVSTKRLRRMTRYSQFGVVAALEALRDAQLEHETPLGSRCGVVFGTGFAGQTTLEREYAILETQGPRRISPFLLTGILPDSVSGHIAIEVGAMGPNMGVCSASATGATAIGEAAEIIRRGDADVMIAGAAEAPLTPLLYASFAALGAMATAGQDPAAACRPFDLGRTGFVVAEGAGAVVLESLEHAQNRGAKPYAELAGYGSADDAFDMVASEPTGRGPSLAMTMALRKAGIDGDSIGYINAHGTASLMNDRVETAAIKRVFGPHAYRLALSST